MILRTAAIVPFVASFVLVLLTDGGVYPGSLSLAVMLMAVSLVIATVTIRLQAQAVPLFIGALAIWLFLSVWTLVQISPLPGGFLAGDAWTYLQPLGTEAAASISMAPGDSLYSLLPLSLAFMTMLSALLLFRTDDQAEMALKVFALCGSALALFAVIQFKLLPGTLMFSAKVNYLSSLTAPFVNRNTAATFYGVVLIAVIVCLALEIARIRSLRGRVASSIDLRWPFAAMILVVVLALALTTSRAGILSAVVAAGGLSAVLFFWLLKKSAGLYAMRRSGINRKSIAFAGLAVVALILATVALFGRTLFRVNMLGGEDGRFCVYPGILKSIEHNWAMGVGAGAFETVFSAYMDPACSTINAWARAHNGYLDLALAYGVPTTLVVLVFGLAVVLYSLVKGMKRRKSKKPMVWAGFALVILVLTHSSVDFSMQIPGFAMSFMLVLSILTTVSVNPAGKR
jgi:O-antigen ligase